MQLLYAYKDNVKRNCAGFFLTFNCCHFLEDVIMNTNKYLSCNGTNIGVIRRFPSARRVSICFSIALTGVMLCGITAGFVDICMISASTNVVGVLLLVKLLLLMLLAVTVIASADDLLSSTFNSSEYSGTMPLSTLDSLILRSIDFPYSFWKTKFCKRF